MTTREHPVVSAFVEGARQTLGTMAMMELDVDEIEPAATLSETLDLTASMGLQGPSGGGGLLVVSLCETVAARVVSCMLGVDPSELGDDLLDGTAEITNMLAGAAKASLSDTRYHFELSIPAVVAGAKNEVAGGAGRPGVVIRCRVQGLPFVICVWMDALD